MKHSDKNIDCAWARERIELYIDNDLGQSALSAFESHVDECKACRQEMQMAKSVVEELRALPGFECPDEVVDRVFDRVEAEGEGQRNGKGWRRFIEWIAPSRFGVPRAAVAGAFVLLIAISSLVAVRVSQREVQPTPEEIAEAEATLKWTFAYVNEVSRRTSVTVRDDVIGERVIGSMRKAVLTTFEEPTPPPKTDGGSV